MPLYITTEIALQTLKHKLVNLCHKNHLKDKFDTEMLNIPECTYNIIVNDDFKWNCSRLASTLLFCDNVICIHYVTAGIW